MELPSPSALAIPGVLLLVAFLHLSSQYLFLSIEPGPLGENEALVFNISVACLLVCYARACGTDPGRIPGGLEPANELSGSSAPQLQSEAVVTKERQRWCKKCDAEKPPRAHHCKTCRR